MTAVGRGALLAAALVLAACLGRPSQAWQPEQAEAVAWWVEDLAHGRHRLPAEIDFVDGGPGAARIARWAAGQRLGERWQPPSAVQRRRERWPALAAALAEGSIQATDDGWLAPAVGLAPERRAAIEPLVEQENAARALLDQLLLTLGAPDPEVERVYRAAVRAARVALDRARD
ncbi:MAG: hypothetical protein N3B15_03510 [Planctomycetota bacterium]|nr:hypothetical protein [Planctomycetota bacterium]MCX8039624.1 hypothetical protein [Planctomycetota bacterium]